MSKKIFVNLPVASSKKSRAFYEALGLTCNEQFSNDDTVCMVYSEEIYFMFLEHKRFADFSPRPLADTTKEVAMLIALDRDTREDVDAVAATALANGGSDNGMDQDLGFMYSKSISDPDGHILEVFYMDMSQMPQG